MLLDWSIALDANNPLSKKGYLQFMLLSCRKAPFYKLHLEDIIFQLYGQVDDSLFFNTSQSLLFQVDNCRSITSTFSRKAKCKTTGGFYFTLQSEVNNYFNIQN